MLLRSSAHYSDNPNLFSRQCLVLDASHEIERITDFLKKTVHEQFHRQGGVVGISGGIDSSVCLALAVKAFGPGHVVGLMLPEKESDPESTKLAHDLANHFGIEAITENISATLDGFGCYQRRDDAIKKVIPEYEPGWSVKIVLPTNLLEKPTLNIFNLVAISPQGKQINKRLPLDAYLDIVAASNFKQRSRMSLLYYHAEARNYAVIGTPNKNERDLGFFVKWGDGGADIFPIGHLYKTQVFQLAEHLNVPEKIRQRTPTTDTYPGGQTQEEFFYRIPFELLDIIWFGYEQGIDKNVIADSLELTPEQVEHVIVDIVRKKNSTEFLRTPPISIS